MPAIAHILNVGQCRIDGPRLQRFLTKEFHATVDQAATKADAEALAAKNSYKLVLVNRILDADRSPGLDVITALHTAHPKLPLMLVSDREEAQAEAVAKGAIKGFGKSALESDETEELLRSLLK